MLFMDGPSTFHRLFLQGETCVLRISKSIQDVRFSFTQLTGRYPFKHNLLNTYWRVGNSVANASLTRDLILLYLNLFLRTSTRFHHSIKLINLTLVECTVLTYSQIVRGSKCSSTALEMPYVISWKKKKKNSFHQVMRNRLLKRL